MNEKRAWWDTLALCKGKTKKGKLCNRWKRRAYKLDGPGDIIFPVTCSLHIEQEEEIRKNAGIVERSYWGE